MARRSASRKAGLKRLAVAGAAAVALAMFAPTAADAARVSNQVSSVAPHSLEATGQEGWRKRNKRGFFFIEGSAEHSPAGDASSEQPAMQAKQDGEEEGDPWEKPDKPIVPGPFYPWHNKDGKDEHAAPKSDLPPSNEELSTDGEDKKKSGLLEGWRKKNKNGGFFFLEGSEKRLEAPADAEEDQSSGMKTMVESDEGTGESAGETYPMQEPSSAAEITEGSASNEGRKFFKKGARRS